MTPIEKAKEALHNAIEYAYEDGDSKQWCSKQYVLEALAAIEAEKPVEEAEDVDSASWTFMSVTEMDVGFLERRERIKILIGQRDEKIREAYHAKKCAECKDEKKKATKKIKSEYCEWKENDTPIPIEGEKDLKLHLFYTGCKKTIGQTFPEKGKVHNIEGYCQYCNRKIHFIETKESK